ncbi:hypothetical protein EXU85_02615 [Spirosoma sp. KCTC 42546]|uniref:hypothetical protein n=1 Tax=Spirosoma sp. KCTC 42546 TaxID=2520506 RepID=UPI001157178E|nr:hypothetical protein [Spirosoma sp. KCTC 42546]QDK77547.1 hypothetical protein EXU85_02615 [Spirosoma sp. KCTC 42546]
MQPKCHSSMAISGFNHPSRAIQNTDWISDPADPTQSYRGQIPKGETVWFQDELFGSGPAWQQVRLADHTLVFINPHHFEPIRQEQLT